MLVSFLDWLPDSTILCAHNAKNFDMHVLIEALNRNHLLQAAGQKVVGFVDTLPLLRAQMPQESSHSLGALYPSIFGQPIASAHDASGDSDALRNILFHQNLPTAAFCSNSATFISAVQYVEESALRNKREKVLRSNLCTEKKDYLNLHGKANSRKLPVIPAFAAGVHKGQ